MADIVHGLYGIYGRHKSYYFLRHSVNFKAGRQLRLNGDLSLTG